MRRPVKWVLYSLYILAMTGLFLYYLFPTEVVKKYLVLQTGKFLYPFEISVGNVRPFLPPGLTLRDLSLRHGNQQYFQLERLKITPAYASLFRTGKTLFITTGAYGGNIKCTLDFSNSQDGQNVAVGTNLTNVALEKVAWLQNIIKRKISGRLSGKVSWDTSLTDTPLKASLITSDCRIGLLPPVLSLESLSFDSVEIDFTLNRQRLHINRVSLRGEQMFGDVSGSVDLRTPLEDSPLTLSGIFKMQPEFAIQLKKNLPEGLLPRENAGGGYPIRIFGTLDKPRFSLK